MRLETHSKEIALAEINARGNGEPPNRISLPNFLSTRNGVTLELSRSVAAIDMRFSESIAFDAAACF